MKVDLRTPPSYPVAEVVAFAQRCEEAGFHACGFNDSQLYFRDAFVVASHVLANTERLVVHPALTCPGPRHASVIASAAKTVQEFGPTRYELWLGRGDAAVSTIGQAALTLSATRKAVSEIKRTMAGEWGVWGDSHVHLHHSGDPPIPVFLGGRASKVIGIAGELCDGVMLGVPPNAESIAQARGWLAGGAAKAGRDPAEVETVLEVRTMIRDTRRLAHRTHAPKLLPNLVRDDAREWLAKRGIDYDLAPIKARLHDGWEKMQQLSPAASHPYDWSAAEEIADAAIPSELQAAAGDTMAVLGDPDYVAAKYVELQAMGIDRIYLYANLSFQWPEDELRAFAEVIGPTLARAETAAAT
jgi:5,10-methylenetetrahydromethanopterin reductase